MKYTLRQDYSFLRNLDPEQKDAVINSSNYSFIVAGPGSGKTTVISYKIAYLINSGIKPSQILLLTFTKAASFEMIKRARRVTNSNLQGIFFGTFHHLGYSLIRKYYSNVNIKENFTVIDIVDSKELIKNCRKDLIQSCKKIPNHSILQKIFSFSCNAMIDLRESCFKFSKSYLQQYNEIEKIYNCYIQKKSEQNLLDYDDLLLKSLYLLESYESIRVNESRKFKWILIDEFQDTNLLQYNIIKHLSQVHGNLIMVGDDAQSIYSFRGVEIDKIKSLLKEKNTKIFKIQHNYRSTKKIVRFINKIIPRNSIKKVLIPTRNDGEKPIVVETNNSLQQALFLVQRIKELLKNNKYKDIAILYRSHYQSIEVQMELQKNNIPYRVLSGLKFNESAHIKDLIAFIKLSINIRDTLSWRRVLKLFDGIGKTSVEKILESLKESNYSIEKSIEKLSKIRKIVKGLNYIKDHILPKSEPDILLTNICESFYFEYLKRKYDNFKDRISDIQKFIEISERYSEMDEFLNDILIDENISLKKDENQITLTTVHQAKGLEWKIVFIISINPGDFPSRLAIANNNIEEEERIFYVAVTRAKNELYLIYQKREINYLLEEKYDFIRKIPLELVEMWEVV